MWTLFAAGSMHGQSTATSAPAEMSLDGAWQVGLERQYTRTVEVPGLAQEPAQMSPGTLWYKRTVTLPEGAWRQAALTLKGARFAPAVYVNGARISGSEGGMAPTIHLLSGAGVGPGRTIELEIALQSLKDLPLQDASAVPLADRWRTNVSSGLWDGLTLHFSGDTRLTGAIPFTEFAARKLSVHWTAAGTVLAGETVRALLLDASGKTLAQTDRVAVHALQGKVEMRLGSEVQPWSPDQPALYRLVLRLEAGSQVVDERASTWGLKEFRARDRRFYLNGEPIQMRGGTVVWQRFLRNPEAGALAWDAEWFQHNILLRLKSYGGNTMRFHLGLPPEELLDLCDRDGLMVQMEWPFFHSVPASEASMTAQWRAWLDVAMRHPSVMIVHGWNETGGHELEAAWRAMNAALDGYPPLVVAHRDTLHLHKYWWSLFENLGLYYDSANQFERAIVVDEFGGNYLDPKGDPGGYPATRETFLRFLGRDHTRTMRLQFHAESNARIGEYWRRIGAAGVLPFCILGGPQDGSSWFLGELREPSPMPVWDALAATFSPESVSLDVWDRNYTPGQHVRVPLQFFNDTGSAQMLEAQVAVLGSGGGVLSSTTARASVKAHAGLQQMVELDLPKQDGDWEFTATLQNAVPGVTHPIVSSWRFHTITPLASPALLRARVGVADEEPELRAMLQQNAISVTTLDDPSAAVLVGSRATWARLSTEVRATEVRAAGLRAAGLRERMSEAIGRGSSVVLLDAGPRDLGQGYRKGDLGPLDGAPVVKASDAYHVTQELFRGVRVSFSSLPEPESHIQPGPQDSSLWKNLPRSATWIWDGLRGGLIAPAAEMDVSGLSAEGFLSQWSNRGADAAALRRGSYFAYQLGGYYAFSAQDDDAAAIAALRKRVKFLADDAPALQAVLDPNAAVQKTDLGAGLRAASQGQAEQLLQLSTCGKGLTRTAIAEMTFGPGRGRLVVSQVLTAGRVRRGAAEPGLYGLRYDPAAEQMVLNMLERVLPPDGVSAPSQAARPR